jgi:hypothetical protein
MSTEPPALYNTKIPDLIFKYVFIGKENYLEKIHSSFTKALAAGVMKEFLFMYTIAAVNIMMSQNTFDLQQSMHKIKRVLNIAYTDPVECDKAVVQLALYIMQGLSELEQLINAQKNINSTPVHDSIPLPSRLIPDHLWSEFQNSTDRVYDDLYHM